jgi:hypothetical protein
MAVERKLVVGHGMLCVGVVEVVGASGCGVGGKGGLWNCR